MEDQILGRLGRWLEYLADGDLALRQDTEPPVSIRRCNEMVRAYLLVGLDLNLISHTVMWQIWDYTKEAGEKLPASITEE